MSIAKEFPNYYKQVLGYVKVNSINDKDYGQIVDIIESNNRDFSMFQSSDPLEFLYFLADLCLLDFYYDKYKNYKKWKLTSRNASKDITYGNKLKNKYVAIYCRIVKQHNEYYERIMNQNLKSTYKFSDILEEEYFLYDLMTLNQEILFYDMMTLNMINANQHEKLIFCYKHYLEGWDSLDILKKLRKMSLDKIFINFVNEYSNHSNLPQVVILCYFYALEESLYKSSKELTKLNGYFTNIKIDEFTSRTKQGKKQMIESIYDNRINLINKWCIRIREKIVDSTIKILTNENISTNMKKYEQV